MKKLFNFHKKHNNEEMYLVPPHELHHVQETHDPHGSFGPEPPHRPYDHHEEHTPPHLRKKIPLDEQETEELSTALNLSFQDEDSANTAFQIFLEVAPPEVQTIIFQISKLYAKLTVCFAEGHNEEKLVNREDCAFENDEPSRRFTILDSAARALFTEVYDDKAPALIEALKGKPNEIIEAAIMLAYLYKQVSVKED